MSLPDNFFDEWKERFADDPSSFEEFSRNLIEEHIQQIADTEQELIKLQQLQFRVDRTLRKYKDPVARMNVMVELLYNHLDQLNSALQVLRQSPEVKKFD